MLRCAAAIRLGLRVSVLLLILVEVGSKKLAA